MRLAQQAKSTLKKVVGIESEEEAAAQVAKWKELEQKETERQRANMTEIEREKTARTEAEQNAARATQRADALERSNALLAAAAARGIKNTDYADFLLRGEKKDADFGKLLDGLIASTDHRAALGVGPVPTSTVPPAPTNPGGPAPAPAPPAPPAKDCSQMSAQEWADYKASLGLR